MRAGRLRNKATIYVPNTASNDWGEVEQSYTELGTYYCSVTTKPRREQDSSDSLVSRTEYDLRFRYYDDLAALPRDAYLTVKGVTLHVVSVANVQMHDREIQLICEERA